MGVRVVKAARSVAEMREVAVRCAVIRPYESSRCVFSLDMFCNREHVDREGGFGG